jgi:hypothetical protein
MKQSPDLRISSAKPAKFKSVTWCLSNLTKSMVPENAKIVRFPPREDPAPDQITN